MSPQSSTKTRVLARDLAPADEGIERITSEIEDAQSSPPLYEIATYPADFTLQVLYEKWKASGITIPPFQRRFVWSQVQASKLIESFLLGLPVPSVFFYTERQLETFLVVDGQQRLRSIFYYFEGYFGDEVGGKRPIFRLRGLNEKSRWHEKSFQDLMQTDQPSANRLQNAVLRSFVVRQLDPKDDTSVFHIFERLNTGGTLLTPQEIRNCICGGPFNELLHELNEDERWRRIFGKRSLDRRMRDTELILRFFALLKNRKHYKKPMKDFLTSFMRTNRDLEASDLEEYRRKFLDVVTIVSEELPSKPFHIRAGLNAAAFDAVFVALAEAERIPKNLKDRFEDLKKEEVFEDATTAGTTDVDSVKHRILEAKNILIGVR